MCSWALTRITVNFASYSRKKKKRLIINAFCEACEMQCVNYQCSMKSAKDTFQFIINTVNKVLCLDMSVRANISIPEFTLGSCVPLCPKSGKNRRKT